LEKSSRNFLASAKLPGTSRPMKRTSKVVGAPEASVWLVASAGRKKACTAGNFSAIIVRIFRSYPALGP
jgi:hypothetical protein